MAPGGVALVLHPTHRLGFSGQKGISKYSEGAVLCSGSAGEEKGSLLTVVLEVLRGGSSLRISVFWAGGKEGPPPRPAI